VLVDAELVDTVDRLPISNRSFFRSTASSNRSRSFSVPGSNIGTAMGRPSSSTATIVK